MRYPQERKEAVLKKMLPPHNKTIRELAQEEGISDATLYNWRKAARAEGRLMPDGDGCHVISFGIYCRNSYDRMEAAFL